jgi:hypothetical protein
MRNIITGVLIGLMALVGMAYGVLGGITLCTVVFTQLSNTAQYRLLLTAGGTMGGIIGAVSNVCLWLVVYGFSVTVHDTLRRKQESSTGGDES